MNPLARLLACLGIALATSTAGAQSVQQPPGAATAPRRHGPLTVFLGPAGGVGELASYDPLTGKELATARLSGVQLLLLDAAGRSELWALRSDVARYRADLPGASRLVLPAESGVLYHYRRAAPSGPRFGFLLLRSGHPWRRIGERAGTGPAGDVDPYLPRVAVSTNGRSLLIATTLAAGGDLIEIDLARAGRGELRSALVPPIDLSVDGLWLNDGWGLAIGGDVVWRFEREPGAQVEAVAFTGAPPAQLAGQAVVSFNRRFALFTGGTGAQSLMAYVVGSSGPAAPVSERPEPLSDAGFLPSYVNGPYLAVSNDGRLASWRREATATENTREQFLARVAAVPQPLQVSADPFFVDTLDQIGAVGFYKPTELLVAVGEVSFDAPGALERVDLFGIRLDANGAPQFTNRTQSSGDLTPPFVPGEIEPRNLHLLEDGSLRFHDNDGTRIWGVAPGSAPLLLLDQVKSIEWIDRAGDDLVCEVRREIQPRPHELYAGRLDAVTPLVALDLGTELTRYPHWATRDDGTLGVLRVDNVVHGFIRRFDTTSASGQTFQLGPAAFDGPLSFDPFDSLVFRLSAGTGPSLHYVWRENGSFGVLQTPALPGIVLPAR